MNKEEKAFTIEDGLKAQAEAMEIVTPIFEEINEKYEEIQKQLKEKGISVVWNNTFIPIIRTEVGLTAGSFATLSMYASHEELLAAADVYADSFSNGEGSMLLLAHIILAIQKSPEKAREFSEALLEAMEFSSQANVSLEHQESFSTQEEMEKKMKEVRDEGRNRS